MDSKLPDLKPIMLKKKSTACPNLRASAAESRYCINFGMEQALASLSDENQVDLALKRASCHLKSCYDFSSQDTFQSHSLRDHDVRFCLLHKTLSENA